MTLLRPVTVPFDGRLSRGVFKQRTDRFTAHITLDSGEEITAHCINPGRMEAFVDPGAVVWARRVPEDPARKGPARKTAWTWELIERDGVLCSTNTQRPNALVAAVLEAKALGGLERSTNITAEPRLPVHGGQGATKSRCDFKVLDADGCDHWIEVKNCHATYTEQELRGYGYFPDSVSERAARHCRELARLVGPRTRCTVLIVASRADATEGIRPSDFHDPTFAEAARAAARAGVVFRGLRASHTAEGTTVENEIPVDLAPPPRETLRALGRAWDRCRPITGWDRTFGGQTPKRVANGPFPHNKNREDCAGDSPPVTSDHFSPKKSAHFSDAEETPKPKKRGRRRKGGD
mmetsp:Transcript_24890/g.74668  ORF Transcript_24890/g.74668 Transcript_24890/m.74668 type:complete len:350 (-) Transcript_24890:13-1062(-)